MDNEEWATDKELVATDDTVAPEFSPEVDSAVDSLFDPGSCVPTCEGRECGDDDCGGSCGMCVDGTTCQIRCTGCPAIEYPDCGTCPAETACRTHVAFCAPFCGPDCIPMVPVPAGPFMMGHDADPDTTYASSSPEHEVDVPAFNIDEYEVTVKAYRGCVYDGSCSPIALNYGMLACWSTLTTFNWVWPDRREHPINFVTWFQAASYCEWAGKRLCTEAEWEKAARGTDARPYPWGWEAPTCRFAVFYEHSLDAFSGGCGLLTTWPVGSKPEGASPYGALDMAGNVSEFVSDWFHFGYDEAPTDGSAWIEPETGFRTPRGGSYWETGLALVTWSRVSTYVSASGSDMAGFRCCRSL